MYTETLCSLELLHDRSEKHFLICLLPILMLCRTCYLDPAGHLCSDTLVVFNHQYAGYISPQENRTSSNDPLSQSPIEKRDDLINN
jgi:hypothetical protein